MPLAMWAKTAVGTNLGFLKLKGYSKALKSFKDVLQQTVWRSVQPKVPARVYNLGKVSNVGKEKCRVQSTKLTKFTESISGRLINTLISTNSNRASQTWAREIRRRVACRLSSSNLKTFQNVPLFSLIGISLGLDSKSIINDNTNKVLKDMKRLFSDYCWEAEALDSTPKSLQDLEISQEILASGCEGAVYKAKMKAKELEKDNKEDVPEENDKEFDLAIKAVFNYGAASNAESILRELHREYVPLHMNMKDLPEHLALSSRVGRLPPHPNIVDMPGVFEDDVLVTEEGLRKFPAAMPRKHNPECCFGRNKTLYLVMRRRSTHLKEYLANNDVSMAKRCLLLAQLLEAVSHLVENGVAHRDLKTDNLLIDVSHEGGIPKLEICDFGCCLAEENRSLVVEYSCSDVNKGGNSWLMAPEIATATPGRGKVLNYRKSDLWAVGAIAYDILGGENPFYPSPTRSQRQLSSYSYCVEDLPPLPETVPDPLQFLVFSMLSVNPQQRPEPSVAAAVVQMVGMDMCQATGNSGLVWKLNKLETKAESRLPVPAVLQRVQRERAVFQWLVANSQLLHCQLTLSHDQTCWDVPHVMRFLFLKRLSYQDFRQACAFL